ncbi:MAG: T9SS type A sorting domain-containing protein, partial [Paludibacteraceae bacterium]|nr:T9SS type A sorting domain-containing protein [Paludibacteraceae bacterium]
STIVPANGRILLWADGNADEGPRHLNFKLSADVSQQLILMHSYKGKNDTLDVFTTKSHPRNGSYGRETDGSKELVVFANCSTEDNFGLEIASPRKGNGEVLCDADIMAGDKLLDTGIVIYPNPVDNTLYVEVEIKGAHHIQITDCMSRRVAEIDSEEHVTAVDVNGLATGVYVITVVSDESTYTTRFIKK